MGKREQLQSELLDTKIALLDAKISIVLALLLNGLQVEKDTAKMLWAQISVVKKEAA